MCPSANRGGVLHWQVAQHNTPHDCWVSFNGGVYDLTPLIKVSPLLGLQLHAATAPTRQQQQCDTPGPHSITMYANNHVSVAAHGCHAAAGIQIN
jgi:hypothetical protein